MVAGVLWREVSPRTGAIAALALTGAGLVKSTRRVEPRVYYCLRERRHRFRSCLCQDWPLAVPRFGGAIQRARFADPYADYCSRSGLALDHDGLSNSASMVTSLRGQQRRGNCLRAIVN